MVGARGLACPPALALRRDGACLAAVAARLERRSNPQGIPLFSLSGRPVGLMA